MKVIIDKPGLTPADLSGEELARFVTAVCTALRKAAGDPGAGAFLALESIEANCISLRFRSSSWRVLRAYVALVTGIAAGRADYPAAVPSTSSRSTGFAAVTE